MMTREERLISMRGVDLIQVGEKLGLKITKNDLKKGKMSVVQKILEAEKAEDNTEEQPKKKEPINIIKPDDLVPAETPAEVLVEAPKTENKAPEKETKQNIKANTKRANLKLTELTYKGETKSIREWANELEMPWPTLYDRVNRNGWSVEDAIEIPLGRRRPRAKKEEK